jgi:hypothetical protein
LGGAALHSGGISTNRYFENREYPIYVDVKYDANMGKMVEHESGRHDEESLTYILGVELLNQPGDPQRTAHYPTYAEQSYPSYYNQQNT